MRNRAVYRARCCVGDCRAVKGAGEISFRKRLGREARLRVLITVSISLFCVFLMARKMFPGNQIINSIFLMINRHRLRHHWGHKNFHIVIYEYFNLCYDSKTRTVQQFYARVHHIHLAERGLSGTSLKININKLLFSFSLSLFLRTEYQPHMCVGGGSEYPTNSCVAVDTLNHTHVNTGHQLKHLRISFF